MSGQVKPEIGTFEWMLEAVTEIKAEVGKIHVHADHHDDMLIEIDSRLAALESGVQAILKILRETKYPGETR
jgi:hypothetical protein